MLHITSGDSSAALLERAGIEGEIVPWREALSEGPAPRLESGKEWIETRARFLSDEYRLGFEGVRHQLEALEGVLERAGEAEEIVLWFDRDLFCQANFLYLLARLSTLAAGTTRISRVYGGEREIGRMSSVEMIDLLDTRIELTAEDLRLGRGGWEAYSSSDPRRIEEFLREPTGRLPHLGHALRLHLGRFPSMTNGLGSIEQWLLERIASGERTFASLFSRFSSEMSDYGMGDWQIWRCLEHLARCPVPLLELDSDIEQDRAPVDADLSGQSYTITDTGRQVLAGDADHVTLNGSDRWLGGVHFATEGEGWRWNGREVRSVKFDE
jgi:hypothetical protein